MSHLVWILYCKAFNIFLALLSFVLFAHTWLQGDWFYSILALGICALVSFSVVLVSYEMDEALENVEKETWKTPIPKI